MTLCQHDEGYALFVQKPSIILTRTAFLLYVILDSTPCSRGSEVVYD
ncbi:hypothetical protein QSI_3315 [Clostridioides difficile P28]|nr:hypothetical protein QSI_3315 [Clostridioides difficile P28]